MKRSILLSLLAMFLLATGAKAQLQQKYLYIEMADGGITTLQSAGTGTITFPGLTGTATIQGNTFNGASQLVQLNASTQYPALSGTLITNLTAANISAGMAGINISGNAATATSATTASNVVTNTVSGNTSYYPALLSSSTGVSSAAVDVGGTGLAFNPSTGTLTAMAFSGPLTGNVMGNVSGSAGSVNMASLAGTNYAAGNGSAITSLAAANLSGTVGVANGGTGTSTAFTSGSIVFAGASGVHSQDNSNFFWDDANYILKLGNVGAGTTLPHSVLNMEGNLNNYVQATIQNINSGNNASADFVATANNGTDSTNYVDFGINGSGYNQAAYNIGKADDGYIYAQGGNLDVGTGGSGASDSLVLFTGGSTTANRAMSIDGSQIITFSKYGAGALSTSSGGVVSAGVLSVANGGTGTASGPNGWIQSKVASTVNLSTTEATVVSFTASASTIYEIEANLDVNGTGSTGVLFAVSSNGTSPLVEWVGQGDFTTTGSAGNGSTGSDSYMSSNNPWVNNFEGFVHMNGIVKSGTGATTISIVAKTVTGTATVSAGSKMLYRVE
jgi:hypothetical protein